MPFTFAHPALVLPFGKISRHYFSITALVVGSLTPDFEYFLCMHVLSIHSHSISGVLYFNLPLSFAIYYLFVRFIREALTIHLPTVFRDRFSVQFIGRNWKVVTYSLILGIASHLAWDSFTHFSGYFVERFQFLNKQVTIGSLSAPVFKLLQHGSTILGLTIILIVIIRLPVISESKRPPMRRFWVLVFGIMVLVLAVNHITGHLIHFGDYIVTIISGTLLGIVLISSYYYVRVLYR